MSNEAAAAHEKGTYHMLKPIAGALLFAAFTALPVAAQENQVAATVDGEEITAADVAVAVSTLAPALEQVPAAQRPQVVLDLLIDMAVLSKAAEAADLDEDPLYEQRLDFYRGQILRDLYMEKVIGEQVTDEAVRARFDEEIGKVEPQKEVSARHILVEDEAKAQELIEELKGGADFAELAEANSTDPGSAARGGDLGFFGPGQMVPEFEQAAMALEPGSFTEAPVQSQFGYHIIKVDDVRESPLPTFDEVKDRIRQLMTREAFVEELDNLKENAAIEKLTPQ